MKNLIVCVFVATMLGGSVVSGQLKAWEIEAANGTAVAVRCPEDMSKLCSSGITVCGFFCEGTPSHIVSWF